MVVDAVDGNRSKNTCSRTALHSGFDTPATSNKEVRISATVYKLQLKILFHLSLTSNGDNEKADHDDTLMNSESLDPRSLSMACLVERLQPRGPGVKSFLSGEVACHYHNLSLAVAFSAIFSFCMRMSSF